MRRTEIRAHRTATSPQPVRADPYGLQPSPTSGNPTPTYDQSSTLQRPCPRSGSVRSYPLRPRATSPRRRSTPDVRMHTVPTSDRSPRTSHKGYPSAAAEPDDAAHPAIFHSVPSPNDRANPAPSAASRFGRCESPERSKGVNWRTTCPSGMFRPADGSARHHARWRGGVRVIVSCRAHHPSTRSRMPSMSRTPPAKPLRTSSSGRNSSYLSK